MTISYAVQLKPTSGGSFSPFSLSTTWLRDQFTCSRETRCIHMVPHLHGMLLRCLWTAIQMLPQAPKLVLATQHKVVKVQPVKGTP